MRRLVVGLAFLALAASTFSWALADDQQIARQVAERLKQEQKEGKLRGFDINLKVAEGKVTFKGNVASAEQKELVVGLARQVDGVKDIEDGLQVKAAAAETDLADSDRARSTVSEPARKTLLSSLFRSTSIRESSAASEEQKKSSKPDEVTKPTRSSASAPAASVVSEPARKTLLSSLFRSTPTRESSAARDEQKKSSKPDKVTKPASSLAVAPAVAPAVMPAVASAVASAVAPAASAASTLDGAPAADKPDGAQIAADRRIGEEVTRQLQQAKGNGQLKGFGMSVHVENGNVWLKGRVGSTAQQQMVLDLARRTEGVRQVINELTVGEPTSSIAQNLNQVLQTAETAGTLRGVNLNVRVDGPDIWFTGTVSKPEQEQLAVDLARKVPGVRRVISGLELKASQSSLSSSAPVASLLPPVAISSSQLDTPQVASAAAVSGMQPAAAVRFTRQAAAPTAEATLVAQAAPATMPTATETPVAAPSAPLGSAAPVAMMPYPVAPNPTPVVGGYVYYNQYPTTQAPMPMMAMDQTPRPLGLPQMAGYAGAMAAAPLMAISQATGMMPAQLPGPGYAAVPARYDQPSLPGYAWPTYAAHPNYAAVTYPKQYSPSAWPYIGPFYPYPQVPLGWRKVTLKWDDGWWNLDFKAK